MRYQFQELGERSCHQIAASIGHTLLGKVAVNTSFDSGRIHRPDWAQVNGFAITPRITQEFITAWPVSHDRYCDEWWVFDHLVPIDFNVHSFCNFIGTRISEYKQLNWGEGCPLDSYLLRFEPVAVFGNNELGYLILPQA